MSPVPLRVCTNESSGTQRGGLSHGAREAKQSGLGLGCPPVPQALRTPGWGGRV